MAKLAEMLRHVGSDAITRSLREKKSVFFKRWGEGQVSLGACQFPAGPQEASHSCIRGGGGEVLPHPATHLHVADTI